MIRLTIKRTDITNDKLIGNYDVELLLPDEASNVGYEQTLARVTDFHRSNGWDALVYLAVKALQQQKKGDGRWILKSSLLFARTSAR